LELDKKIYRLHTKELNNKSDKCVYDLFQWKRVDVKLTNHSTGEIITDMKDLEFPAGYSQSACDIIACKFFRKKGVPVRSSDDCPDERGYEYSMRQLVHRMVNFWVEALYDEAVILEEQKQIVYDELAYMMLAQIWAPNSPQFFNTGLKLAYDIPGMQQGHFYYDEKSESVAVSADAYTRTQGSACFILGVEDSLIGKKSLTDQLTTETLLFKYGSGAGSNWSAIRGKNEMLSGGGKSSGLLSFLKVSDRNAGAIKSGGTTRRAAKMNILNLGHPEILDFITWKAREEKKAKALGEKGYAMDIDGEAYETVSGQNANNSIRVPDAFMKQLDQPGAMWELTGRVDENADSKIPVSVIWDKTAESAWACGDPGIQFDNTINAWHTCPYGEDGVLSGRNRINASNPCSEYMFLDDTACNLASINILKFYDMEMDTFDIDAYLHTIFLIQLVLEATIHWGQFPTEDIARRSYLFRTTGLGLTNLGTLFMCMGLPYDSDEARSIGAALCSLLTGYSYYTSALMAEKVGPFPCYEINKQAMKRAIHNHARATSSTITGGFKCLFYEPVCIDTETIGSLGYDVILEHLHEVWIDAIAAGEQHGYRNAQVTALAPTGTISFAMDCATTSSEPFFSHIAYKKLVGGNCMAIVNPAIPAALNWLGYSEKQIADITGYVMQKNDKGEVLDGKIEGAPHLITEHYSVFDTANKCGTGSRAISPAGHVKMMGALTPHITGAISKTVNLDSEATVDDIKDIYRYAWQLGIKAITVYRDGCKSTQPLNSHKAADGDDPRRLELRHIKPLGIRNARVHEAEINGMKLYITVSFYEDRRVGEIYVTAGRQGSLIKGLLDSLSTTVSKMLQYGVPAAEIARIYRGHKYEPNGIVIGHPYIKFVDSISDLISKIIDIERGDFNHCQIKPDGYVTLPPKDQLKEPARHRFNDGDYIHGETCPNCNDNKMVRNGTCSICTVCGTTTGCS